MNARGSFFDDVGTIFELDLKTSPHIHPSVERPRTVRRRWRCRRRRRLRRGRHRRGRRWGPGGRARKCVGGGSSRQCDRLPPRGSGFGTLGCTTRSAGVVGGRQVAIVGERRRQLLVGFNVAQVGGVHCPAAVPHSNFLRSAFGGCIRVHCSGGGGAAAAATVTRVRARRPFERALQERARCHGEVGSPARTSYQRTVNQCRRRWHGRCTAADTAKLSGMTPHPDFTAAALQQKAAHGETCGTAGFGCSKPRIPRSLAVGRARFVQN